MTPRRVLVTDAGRTSSLAVIRSLGRAGHTVVAADSASNPTGARSRYATELASYPSPFVAGAGATAAALAGLARRHRIDVIVPVTDDVIVPLDEHRNLLPDGCTLAMPDHDLLHAAGSKVGSTRLARSLGIGVPRHEIVHRAADTEGIIDRLGAPVVVKPDRSRIIGPDGRLQRGSVAYAWTDDEARRAVEAAGQEVVIQAYHQGVGHGIGMVLADGRPLLAVQHRRLHEVPVTGGASARRVTVAPDPDLLASACAILGELGWTGAAMVEFKVGADGPAFMEINGRLWGSLPLAVLAGCDIPSRMVDVHLGEPEACAAPLDTSYRTDVVSRNLDLELLWIGSVLAKGRKASNLVSFERREGVLAAVDLLRSNQGDDLAAPDDRRPVLTGVRRAFGHAAHKAWSHG
ncbi:ATP-grasp domain-containing protein [Aquihabitans sp. McL0605]|uniref:carboxylate--amine ligase n=1 Tax=Aquihabitans sp. McL0605 TaxID=3415671 RepID=UPI003CE77963